MKKYETYRKATEEELLKGSPEMILVSEDFLEEEPMIQETPPIPNIPDLLKYQTPEQIAEIKRLLGII